MNETMKDNGNHLPPMSRIRDGSESSYQQREKISPPPPPQIVKIVAKVATIIVGNNAINVNTLVSLV